MMRESLHYLLPIREGQVKPKFLLFLKYKFDHPFLVKSPGVKVLE